jgi:hypothetical protein
MAKILGLSIDDLTAALEELTREDLITHSDRVVQVLPVPARSERDSRKQGLSKPTTTASEPHPLQTDANGSVPEELVRAFEPEARRRIAHLTERHSSLEAIRKLASALALQANEGRTLVMERQGEHPPRRLGTG